MPPPLDNETLKLFEQIRQKAICQEKLEDWHSMQGIFFESCSEIVAELSRMGLTNDEIKIMLLNAIFAVGGGVRDSDKTTADYAPGGYQETLNKIIDVLKKTGWIHPKADPRVM